MPNSYSATKMGFPSCCRSLCRNASTCVSSRSRSLVRMNLVDPPCSGEQASNQCSDDVYSIVQKAIRIENIASCGPYWKLSHSVCSRYTSLRPRLNGYPDRSDDCGEADEAIVVSAMHERMCSSILGRKADLLIRWELWTYKQR